MNILYIKQQLLGRPFRCGGGGDDSGGGTTDNSLTDASWDSMNQASQAALSEAVSSANSSAQQAADAGFNGSLESLTNPASDPSYADNYSPGGGWGSWADTPEDTSPAPDTSYEDTAKGAQDAAEAIADKASSDNVRDLVISLIGFAVGGPLGKAISAFGPSLAAGERPGGRSIGGFIGGLLGGSGIGGAIGSQLGGMVGQYADTGKAPSWGDWGGLATTAAGLGAFPGQAVGRYAQTGQLPSAASVASYTVGRIAPEFGWNPGLASSLAGRAVGELTDRGYASPESAVGDIFGGGGGGDWNIDLSGGGTSTPVSSNIAPAYSAPSGAAGSIRFGGFGLSEGGQGSGAVLPDILALLGTGESAPGVKKGTRIITKDGKSSSDGSQGSDGEAPFGVVLARTLGGRRAGF